MKIKKSVQKAMQKFHVKELRKTQIKPMDDIEVIIRTGVQMQRVKSIEHNGCICFRLADLTRYLQFFSGREDLSPCDVSATLRLHNMLRMDASSKSTCKVRGKRMVCIPKNRLFEKNGW